MIPALRPLHVQLQLQLLLQEVPLPLPPPLPLQVRPLLLASCQLLPRLLSWGHQAQQQTLAQPQQTAVT
jgi:hypothetical protein